MKLKPSLMGGEGLIRMKILIACEYSGVVRDAFLVNGHDVLSCDLLPTESRGPHHQGDVRTLFKEKWDMMIAFPPCTHLAVSGARWFKDKQKEQKEAIEFFMAMVNAPIERIAIENPIGIMSTKYRKPDQIIQPWQFGEDASKATCLWLKNLPLLIPTNIILKERYKNQTPSGQNNLPPSHDRWKKRSKTYLGIADAMADQWDISKFNANRDKRYTSYQLSLF